MASKSFKAFVREMYNTIIQIHFMRIKFIELTKLMNSGMWLIIQPYLSRNFLAQQLVYICSLLF